MAPEAPSPADVTRGFNHFFRAAFDGKTGLTLERLQTLFDTHITMGPDHAAALLHMATEDPATLARLAQTLKQAADQAHPALTGHMSEADILAYTLNTLADGFRISLKRRFTVSLPADLESHGDSLFVHEGQKTSE